MLDSRASAADQPDSDEPRSRGLPTALIAVLAVVAVAVGLAVGSGPELSSQHLLIVFGAVAGIVFALLAVNRFWWLILLLYLTRPSLDALKPSDSGAGLEAGTIVGVIFLTTAAVWLFVQWRSGRLLPMSPASIAMLALSGALLLSTPGAVAPFTSTQTAMKFVAVAVMFVVLEQVFLREPERIVSLLAVTFGSLAVPAIVGLTQAGGVDEGTVPGVIEIGRIEGTFVHANMFAAYLVIIGLLAVALIQHIPRWRIALVLVVVIVVPMLILTYARGAWIGLYLGLLFIGLAQSRALLLGLFAATIVVAIMVPSVSDRLSDLDFSAPKRQEQVDANSAEWRVDYWRGVLPMADDSPITGVGIGMIPEETAEAAPAHSVFVDVIVETGALGVLGLLALVIAVWSGLRRAGRLLTDGPARGLAVGAAAIGLAVLTQFFSESLLTQPAVLWYAVGPIAWSIAAGRLRSWAGVPEAAAADPMRAFATVT